MESSQNFVLGSVPRRPGHPVIHRAVLVRQDRRGTAAQSFNALSAGATCPYTPVPADRGPGLRAASRLATWPSPRARISRASRGLILSKAYLLRTT